MIDIGTGSTWNGNAAATRPSSRANRFVLPTRLVRAVAVISLGLLGCGNPPTREILRVSSPDRIVDAVLVESEVGATVATPSLVYIVPSRSRDFDDPVLRGDKFEDLKLAWTQPRYLEIAYSRGRIFSFQNFWERKDVDDFSYKVEIRLKPTSEKSLP